MLKPMLLKIAFITVLTAATIMLSTEAALVALERKVRA